MIKNLVTNQKDFFFYIEILITFTKINYITYNDENIKHNFRRLAAFSLRLLLSGTQYSSISIHRYLSISSLICACRNSRAAEHDITESIKIK